MLDFCVWPGVPASGLFFCLKASAHHQDEKPCRAEAGMLSFSCPAKTNTFFWRAGDSTPRLFVFLSVRRTLPAAYCRKAC